MVTPWLSRLSWLYNSTIIIRRNTAHAYILNTVKLASIILSIIGEFYQQCWHSIIGQRLSIICQCQVGMACQQVCKHNEDMMWKWRFWGQEKPYPASFSHWSQVCSFKSTPQNYTSTVYTSSRTSTLSQHWWRTFHFQLAYLCNWKCQCSHSVATGRSLRLLTITSVAVGENLGRFVNTKLPKCNVESLTGMIKKVKQCSHSLHCQLQ